MLEFYHNANYLVSRDEDESLTSSDLRPFYIFMKSLIQQTAHFIFAQFNSLKGTNRGVVNLVCCVLHVCFEDSAHEARSGLLVALNSVECCSSKPALCLF